MNALPSGSVKNAMWQTPVSKTSPAKTTPRSANVEYYFGET